MHCARYSLLLVLMLALLGCVTAAVQAQDGAAEEDPYESAQWAGRDASPRAGVDLSAIDVEGATADEQSVAHDGTLVRRFRVDGVPAIRVRARVCDDAPAAHAALLAALRLRSTAALAERVEALGFSVGDVGFAGALNGRPLTIWFARANVVVRIDLLDANFDTDLAALAMLVDAAILDAEEVDSAADLPKPAFSALAPENAEVATGDETTVTVEVSAPGNPALDVQFEIDPSSTGAGYVEERNGTWVFVAESPGDVTIICHATTPTGLRQTQSTTIRVTP